MKTYTKTETKNYPKLEIKYDDCPDSPRTWSNLGYFLTLDSNYNSPDTVTEYLDIITETGDIAESQEQHMELIKREVEKELDEKVIAIYPVVKYEHGGIVYSLGNKTGFDYSNNGFYIITDKTAKELGVAKKDFDKVIENELKTYNQYANGEVYRFVLYDDNGEVEDSCGGFYGIEDMKDHLTKEWQDEVLDEYFVE